MDMLNIKDFLKSAGLRPIPYDDFLPELIKATGSELAAEEIIFEIGNRHESTLLDEQKIYKLKNKTLAIAQVVNSYYDYNHYVAALKVTEK